jgi:MYXO-CTERM domain-containing protein
MKVFKPGNSIRSKVLALSLLVLLSFTLVSAQTDTTDTNTTTPNVTTEVRDNGTDWGWLGLLGLAGLLGLRRPTRVVDRTTDTARTTR